MTLYLIAIHRTEYRSAERLRTERGAAVLANKTHVAQVQGRAICGTTVPAGGVVVVHPEHPDREGWMWRLTCKKCRAALDVRGARKGVQNP